MITSNTGRMVTAIVALVAVGLMAFATHARTWYVADSNKGEFSIGLIAAEMCLEQDGTRRCREASLASFNITNKTPRLGIAVLLATVFAGLLLMAATARLLIAARGSSWLPKAALAASLFAGILAGLYLWMSPWSETMVPGRAAILYFIGAGLSVATALVPLGALHKPSTRT